jgi:hypothetical protein
MASKSTSQTGISTTVSLESEYLRFFLDALSQLPKIWLERDGEGNRKFDPATFNLQLLYLIRILPNSEEQDEIIRRWGNSSTTFKNTGLKLSDVEIQAYAGMEIVTSLIIYITQALDLVSEDVVAPGTDKEFENMSEKKFRKLEATTPDIPDELLPEPEAVKESTVPAVIAVD